MCENGTKIGREAAERMIARLQALTPKLPTLTPKISKMNKFKIVGEWDDSLIWCPSQCELKVKYKGKNYVIYLRWRHSDPWSASLIPVDKQFSEDSHFDNEWINLDIPHFIDDQLEECKKAAIKAAKKVLNES